MKVSYGKTVELSETSAKLRDDEAHEEEDPHQEQEAPCQARLCRVYDNAIPGTCDVRGACPHGDPFSKRGLGRREKEEKAEHSTGEGSTEGERANEWQEYRLIHRMPFLSLTFAFRAAMVQL